MKRIISQDLSTQIKCTLVHSLFWASYCAYSSFIVTMLTDYGYSSATATAMMTATSVLSFIAQPVSGYICDNYIPHKWVYIILTICRHSDDGVDAPSAFFACPDDDFDAAVYRFYGPDAGTAGCMGYRIDQPASPYELRYQPRFQLAGFCDRRPGDGRVDGGLRTWHALLGWCSAGAAERYRCVHAGTVALPAEPGGKS